MNPLNERLHMWALEELNLASEAGLNQIPDKESFRCLTQPKYKKMWNYVISHVRSQSTVQRVKRTLLLKRHKEEMELNVAAPDQELFDVSELQANVFKAEERQQFLKRNLLSVEDNILSYQKNVDSLVTERQSIYQKTAILELLTRKHNNKVTCLNSLNQELVLYKNKLQAYQYSNPRSLQSDDSFSYGILCDDELQDGVCFQVKQLNNVVYSIIETKLSSGMINSSLLEEFSNCMKDLHKKGFLLTNLLYDLGTLSNSEKQHLTKMMLNPVSVREGKLQTEAKELVKQLLRQLKFESVRNSLCTLRSKRKKDSLLSTQMQKCQEIKDSIKTNASDFDLRYALVETCAENKAFDLVNASLEEHLRQINERSEILKQDCEAVNDIGSLTEQFYKNADKTFYLLNTASSAFNKLLSCAKDLQSFVQEEAFQSRLPSDGQLGIKDMLSVERKLMWDFYSKLNVPSSLASDPYDIKYPLSPQLKRVLPVKDFENFSVACERLINLKDELKIKGSKLQDPSDINVLDFHERITNNLFKMRNSIQESEGFLHDGMIGCERNKSLIEEWWEQKAQFIPEIEYEGKSLKMWADILHALHDFNPK